VHIYVVNVYVDSLLTVSVSAYVLRCFVPSKIVLQFGYSHVNAGNLCRGGRCPEHAFSQHRVARRRTEGRSGVPAGFCSTHTPELSRKLYV